jgi:two-component sensor histidine kinase
MGIRLTNAVVNTCIDAMIGDQSDNGYLRIYDGTIPTNADTAIGAQVLLAELRWNAAAFAAASSPAGQITANALTADASANATGTASWFRSLKSDGTTVLCDGTVSTSGADCNLNTVSIVSGANVSISSATFTMPKS